MDQYYYLLLILLTLMFPLAWSFESKIQYYKKWFALFPAIFITTFFFIGWDQWFTYLEVWSFNEQYLIGKQWGNLPLEECLFFVVIPFSTLFIYEVMRYYWPRDPFRNWVKEITWTLALLLIVIAVFNWDKLYTRVNFLTCAIILMGHYLMFKKKHLGLFFVFYLIHLIPFLLVNGALTGAFSVEPVVIYNPKEVLGIRVFTIPIEDFVYSMGLMLMNISFYEGIKTWKLFPIRLVK
ncbi:lycopene cyclase domain-containing protein [Echinicola jeungdonensis]|nr:lycopene cyclase domain-containing protein [Echinicola jeungdonensis]MDN3669236.1 lycopene cyclase domain-containing protein [Echinicola jeungdonensis]